MPAKLVDSVQISIRAAVLNRYNVVVQSSGVLLTTRAMPVWRACLHKVNRASQFNDTLRSMPNTSIILIYTKYTDYIDHTSHTHTHTHTQTDNYILPGGREHQLLLVSHSPSETARTAASLQLNVLFTFTYLFVSHAQTAKRTDRQTNSRLYINGNWWTNILHSTFTARGQGALILHQFS